jgi:hypothetical protein
MSSVLVLLKQINIKIVDTKISSSNYLRNHELYAGTACYLEK